MKYLNKLTFPRLTALALLMFSGYSFAELPTMQVFKTETCGCCNDWIDHIEAAGFEVESTNVLQMQLKKINLGVPSQLASCHTAVIDGYVIEGHVPASDILQLLQQKPNITGLAVPGMPHGSPGMETGRIDAYDVLTFDAQTQSTYVWSSYP